MGGHGKLRICLLAAALAIVLAVPASAKDYREKYKVPYASAVVKLASDGTDMKDEIQAALDLAKKNKPGQYLKVVLVGDFKIRNFIMVHSNTVIDARKATITSEHSVKKASYMLRNDEDDRIGGYALTKNVWILGGTWSGGKLSEVDLTSDTFSFGHMTNLNIIGATVKNNFGAHLIELTGVKDALIQDCEFGGFKPSEDKYNGKNGRSLAIQLEVAYPSLEAAAGGFLSDRTVCKDIRIIANKFNLCSTPYEKFDSCVGSNNTHVDEGIYQDGIKILGNTFYKPGTGGAGSGAYLKGWDNYQIEGNRVIASGFRGISAIGCKATKKSTINENTITGCETNAIVIHDGTEVTQVNGNTIKNSGECGIKVAEDECVVDNANDNYITESGLSGIYAAGGDCVVNNANNNRIYNSGEAGILAANTAVIINAKGNKISGDKENALVGNIRNTGEKNKDTDGKAQVNNTGGKATAKKTGSKGQALRVSVKSAILGAGESLKLGAKAGAGKKGISYKSSAPRIAGVDKNGTVHAKKSGKAVITVSYKKQTVRVRISVKKAPGSASIAMGKAAINALSIKARSKARLRAMLPSGTASYKSSWSSSNPKVASINAGGVLDAKKPGVTRVTFRTYNGKKKSITVRVL